MLGRRRRLVALLAAASTAALVALWPAPARAGHGARRSHHGLSLHHASRPRAWHRGVIQRSVAVQPVRVARPTHRLASK